MAIYRNGVKVTRRPTPSSSSSSEEDSVENYGFGQDVMWPHQPAEENGVTQASNIASQNAFGQDMMRPPQPAEEKDIAHLSNMDSRPSEGHITGLKQKKRKIESANMVSRVVNGQHSNGEPAEEERRTQEGHLSSRVLNADPQDGATQACQVGDSICHLPSELMELEDLHPILSLDAWNFLLTEEERESLSAYLPDMDESNFKETLRQLFAGSNFNFSSPMSDLMKQLKDGLCDPDIVVYRKALGLLERKRHYHDVRNYHNGLVNTCLEMRSLWLSHGDAGLDERLKQWYAHKSTCVSPAQVPSPQFPPPMDEGSRLREASPTSDEKRALFQREEAIRYAFPDMAFFYSTAKGKKSTVAPLKRVGGKPNSKARDHPILKLDRPSHVTILCLVRDAAARLPDSIGTRADVCKLVRDSQYIVDDVSDAQLSQVVSGALDRLHCERDPCVRYDGEKKLWVYLHSDRNKDDFYDNGTASMKRSRRSKKDEMEQMEYTCRNNQEVSDSDNDVSLPHYASAKKETAYEIYPTAGAPELLYDYHHSDSSTSTPSSVRGQFREEFALPFIDLPPSVQPACANMQSSGLGSIVRNGNHRYITLGMHL